MGYTDGKAHAVRYAGAGAHRCGAAGGAMKICGQPYPFFLAHQLDATRGPARRSAGPDRRLAGGMEVRRHPRPDRQARRAGLALVARRGAGDRALPGNRGSGAGAARWHRARRRDAGVGRRPARALCRCCSSASAARRSTARCWPTRQCASWPTTCWSMPARTCGRGRSMSAASGWRPAGGHGPAAVASGAARQLGRPGRTARGVAPARRGRLHAQAAGRRLWGRPHQGRGPVVEVEDRAAAR
jgi:hypothetical protein